jgi:hypothetical protein
MSETLNAATKSPCQFSINPLFNKNTVICKNLKFASRKYAELFGMNGCFDEVFGEMRSKANAKKYDRPGWTETFTET